MYAGLSVLFFFLAGEECPGGRLTGAPQDVARVRPWAASAATVRARQPA